MLAVKRKRGRPRRDEGSAVNDFDASLIKQFELRPAFYDRAHPQYRNREFVEPLWDEIANVMGYSVKFVKDRIMQLRNRYNIEKRRIESLQKQCKDADITSQWALFSNLEFLGNHIKGRRNYAGRRHSNNNASDSSDAEEADELDIDAEKDNENVSRNRFVNGNATAAEQTSAGIFRPTTHQHAIESNANAKAVHHAQMSLPVTRHQNHSYNKYKAFGEFLASSLIEMNEAEALVLVDKFTSELVKALLDEQETKQTTNGSNKHSNANSAY